MKESPPASNRKEALEQGKTSFIGNPCKDDNSIIRSASNGQCLQCQKKKQKQYREMRKSIKYKVMNKRNDWKSVMGNPYAANDERKVRYDLH